MASEKIYLVHKDVEGIGSCLPSALPHFLDVGWTVAEHSQLPAALQPPAPPEPQFVEAFGELVPAEDDAGLHLEESGSLTPEPDWTAPTSSKKTAKEAADKTEES